ncbi:MAG: transposase [candidate division WOR-3 bacterium]|nr:transposase [candidate division WOR-3 bacterium]
MTEHNRFDRKGYFYHIYVRGQRGQPLFFSKDDMGAFINILKQVLDETDIELYAYALIRNHFHLLVYRNNTSLAQFMSKLNIRYALYFNNKYNKRGHVFQGRFGSKVITEEEYNLPRVINYIHYNPQKHNMADDSIKYPFCSAGFYSGKGDYIEHLKKIDYDRTITDREFETYKGCIGTKEQYLKLLKRKPGREKSRFKERRRKNLRHDLRTLLKENKLEKEVFHRRRNKKEQKSVISIIRYLIGEGYYQSEVARELGLHKSTVSRLQRMR